MSALAIWLHMRHDGLYETRCCSGFCAGAVVDDIGEKCIYRSRSENKLYVFEALIEDYESLEPDAETTE